MSLMADLVLLSRELGRESRDWAAVAEGNVSGLSERGTMLVKTSGSRLRSATAEDFVEADVSRLLALLDAEELTDRDVDRALLDSVVQGIAKRPSVEALSHAVCLTTGQARVVAHSHPTAVNALLCSDKARSLIEYDLFPDQIVVLGRHQLMVPYVDPGLALARRMRQELLSYSSKWGTSPRVVYLENHGLFALGSSAQEALDITEMATKAARVLIGAMSVGAARYLGAEDSDRIDTRPDELDRRQQLRQPQLIAHIDRDPAREDAQR